MTTQRQIAWEFFEAQFRRLAFLPGYDRVQGDHWAEWYATFAQGWFPHELQRAISSILGSPTTEFFPAPGRVIDAMQRHRNSLGARDWDSTLAALVAEANGGEPQIAAPACEDRDELEGDAKAAIRHIPGAFDIGRLER